LSIRYIYACRFDTELVIGDTRQLVFPVEALDKEADFADLSDIADVKYEITGDIEGNDTVFSMDLSDVNLEITEAGAIDSIEFDDIDPTTDVISVFLEPVDTAMLPVNNVEHELQIEDINENITTVMQGDIDTIPTAIEPRQS